MAKLFLLSSLSLYTLLLFISACYALTVPYSHSHIPCQLDNLTTLEPDHRIVSEGGVTETWHTTQPELHCLGVGAVVKRTINPASLLLPYYTNYPEFHYIIQGEGVAESVVPGCGNRTIIHIRSGDVIVSHPGLPFWAYNRGREQVVVISVGFINYANQLGVIPRRFYLAGNNTEENFNLDHNVFSGLDKELLEHVLNVNEDIVRKIQSEDPRGQIVKVRGQFTTSISSSPQPITTQERNRHQSGYLEACTFKFHDNIIDNSSYTVYNPRAGRLSTLDNFNLPILHLFKFSARNLILYKNGIASPSWEVNGHRLMYVIRGQAKVQVVNSEGNSVFNGEAKKGQVLVIPQCFVATKQAGSEGFEAIEFVTNENSMFVSLVGMHSLVRSIPGDVLANAYRLNPDEVSALMFNQSQGPLVNY